MATSNKKAKSARAFLAKIKTTNPELFYKLINKADWFLGKDDADYSAKDLKTVFRAELNRDPDMNPIKSPDTYGIKLAIDAVADDKEDASSAKRLFGNTLDQVFKENIDVDIDIGDTVLGGRFKNKSITIKKIGKDELNQPTINDRPLLKYRIKKDMPEKKKNLKETYEEELMMEDPITLGLLGAGALAGTGAGLYKKFKPKKYKQGKDFESEVYDLANGIIESSNVAFALMAYNEALEKSKNPLSSDPDGDAFEAHSEKVALKNAIKAEIPLYWDMEQIASDYNFNSDQINKILNDTSWEVLNLILDKKVERLTEEEWKSGGVRFFQMGDSLPKKLSNRKANSKKPIKY